jgi:hypothetical protein
VAAAETKGASTQCTDGLSIISRTLFILCVVLVIILIVIVIIISLIVIIIARQLPAAASFRRRRSATPDSSRRVQSAVRVGRASRARAAQVSSQPVS